MSLEHRCDKCTLTWEPDHCLCDKHLEEVKQESYDEGFRAGDKSGNDEGYEKGFEDGRKAGDFEGYQRCLEEANK